MTNYILYPPGTGIMAIVDFLDLDNYRLTESECPYHGKQICLSLEIEINGGHSEYIIFCKHCLDELREKVF